MGANKSSFLSPLSNYINRKRKSSASDLDQNIPCCKKFCPEDTIYEQCFVKGLGHDIVVIILGKRWKLHKESLIKSPYFACMFSGSWTESNKQEIEIQIPNPKITHRAIHIVLGSLYQSNISFEKEEIFSVIAAATLFQLDDLVSRCEDILIKFISFDNVLLYYEVAKQYSLNKVLKAALSFLLINLVLFYPSKPQQLRSISVDLMLQLISSPNLVTSSSLDVYRLLRLWLLLKTIPASTDLTDSGIDLLARSYFLDRPKSPCYLHTSAGAQYSRVFQALELFPLISVLSSIEEIQTDNILPLSWITSLYETVVPIVSSIMHPTHSQPHHDQPQPSALSEKYAVHIREGDVSRHCVKWSTTLSKDEMCTDRNRSTWIKWSLFSFGLTTSWKFTGSTLKVMFTPSPLFEGNLLGETDIKYVPLYCRFTIYCLGACHQQISTVTKSSILLLEKFWPKDLFSFHQEDFGGDSVTSYILSLQVFVVHRVVLYKLMKEKLVQELRTTGEQLESASHPSARRNSNGSERNNNFDIYDPDESNDDVTDSETELDVEGEDSSSDSGDSFEIYLDELRHSSDSEAESDQRRLEPPEANFPSPPFSFAPPLFDDSSLVVSMLACDKRREGKPASEGEVKGEEVEEEPVVRIVLPMNIHTDTVY